MLVLASTSPFRKELLNRLHLSYETFAPNVDETILAQETPTQLVRRLAKLKAQAAQKDYSEALIIGSDQVAVINNKILEKPKNHDNAVEQLNEASDNYVEFITGLCLLNSETNNLQIDNISFKVKFKKLTEKQIENYLIKDKPYNCAGSFKSEGLGIALLDSMIGSDSTAVIGLPLICLVNMLKIEGLDVLTLKSNYI
jgi:septum formation protein